MQLSLSVYPNYKDLHRLNYPGVPLLNRSFGEEWTDNYLKNYLFG